MQITKKITDDRILLFVILIIAAILRFWNFSGMPFMYDELSALFRAQAHSFSELIQKAKETDVHPVGIPVFVHYWSALFGKGEMVLKFPFILFSIASIYYTYKIAEKWFNSTVGLLSTACMATLQFPVMYGQMERPYASGMLFTVLMVWCWTNFFFGVKIKQNWYLIGFVIAASLCAMNHYFSLLFAFMVGATGLLFMNKQNYLKYLLGCISIVILFLPHISIFLYQLSQGGAEDDNWIGKPSSDWFFVFIKYLFHFSKKVYLLMLLLFLGSLFYIRKEKIIYYKMHIIAFVWTLLPFLTAYYYSVYKSPVLQFSTMTFSLPFLLIFIFSFYPKLSNPIKTVLLTFIISVNVFTLFTVRKHNEIFYKQPYDQMAKISIEMIDKNGEKNVTIALSVVDGFMNYYFEKYKRKFNFFNTENFDPKGFRNFVNKQTTDFFVAGHLSSDYNQIIKERYPYMIKKEDGFSYSVYCFSKQKPDDELHDAIIFSEENSFRNKSKYWDEDTSQISKNNNRGTEYKLDSTNEYGPAFSAKLKDITNHKHNRINAKATVYSNDTTANPVLVLDIQEGGKSIVWRGADYSRFNNNPKENNTIYISELLSDFDFKKHPDAEVKIYIWNRNKKNIFIKNVTIEVVKSNSLIYSLYQPIEQN